MKILSPAGNFECLKMAIYNGADEVYLGINHFNARNNIDGFTIDTLEKAVDFAHIYNVKVNLAINILFSNEELQDALNTIVKAYNMGVDCFIIQDLGLASLIHKNYPEIEIHASTQMAIHNLEGVKFVEQFGFKRIVLARETPLNEIKRIRKHSNVELEYFAQGALCVSFSGNCYLSSYLCNASGNRGKCKQLCRLPYTLEYKNKPIKTGFLLSAKDFCMAEKLTDLKQAGINVIKIEGRARRPYYVGATTKEYYNLIHNKNFSLENLQLGFNREYTPGYFNGNNNIISNIQNHIGIFIGKITKINLGKKFNEIFFSSNRELNSKSTFKIINNNKEKTTLTAYDLTNISKNQYKMTTTQTLSIGDSIHLIVDFNKEVDMLNFVSKNAISINLLFEQNQPARAIVNINNSKLEILGSICEISQNKPLTINEIETNFAKNDFFIAKLTTKLENVFLTKQQLNSFRRDVYSKIIDFITKQFKRNLVQTKISFPSEINKFQDFQIVDNLKTKLINKNIIFSPETYDIDSISKFINICKNENKKPFLDLPNFALEQDIILLKEIIKETNVSVVANNYYALHFNTETIIGAGLNVYNFVSASIFNKPVITAESNISNKITFPYMTLRHCPMKEHLNASCKSCPFNDGYLYNMDNGTKLKLKRKKLSTCTFYLTT